MIIYNLQNITFWYKIRKYPLFSLLIISPKTQLFLLHFCLFYLRLLMKRQSYSVACTIQQKAVSLFSQVAQTVLTHTWQVSFLGICKYKSILINFSL